MTGQQGATVNHDKPGQPEPASSQHMDPTFIAARSVLLTVTGLGLLIAVSLLLMWELMRALDAELPTQDQAISRGKPGVETEVSIEKGEALRQLRERQLQELNSYGWIDQSDGIARIPIERAMQLLIEQNRSPEEEKASHEQ